MMGTPKIISIFVFVLCPISISFAEDKPSFTSSYEIAIQTTKRYLNPGETFGVFPYISGYADYADRIRKAKLAIYCDWGVLFKEAYIPGIKEPVKGSTDNMIIGNIQRVFKDVQLPDNIPDGHFDWAILGETDTIRVIANIPEDNKGGNSTFRAILTYHDGTQWKTTKAETTIHVSSYFERNQFCFVIIGIITAIFIGIFGTHLGGGIIFIFKKIWHSCKKKRLLKNSIR